MVDPRPDLQQDSSLWSAVLVAAADDPVLQGLLHGLRCGGARLERRGNGTLKLDYRPLLDTWQEEHLLTDWLMPNRNKIAQVFRQAAQGGKTT